MMMILNVVKKIPKKVFEVLVSKTLTGTDAEELRYAPKRFIPHPDYDPTDNDNDFAIIQLHIGLVFSARVNPVCLPNPDYDYDDVLATVSGWGLLTSTGPPPFQLQKVNVNTMTNVQCTTSPNLWLPNEITDNMICAADDGKDACEGDSGGPMVTNEEGFYSLIGVVSFGLEDEFGNPECAISEFPGVYSRVTAALAWIENYVIGIRCEPPL